MANPAAFIAAVLALAGQLEEPQNQNLQIRTEKSLTQNLKQEQQQLRRKNAQEIKIKLGNNNHRKNSTKSPRSGKKSHR